MKRAVFIIILGISLSAFISAGAAMGDTICLKNGGKINGTIIKDDGAAVTIDIGSGTVTHNKKDIVRVITNIPREKTVRPTLFTGVTQQVERPSAAAVSAPKPKAKILDVFDTMVDGVKSVLRFDFLKRTK